MLAQQNLSQRYIWLVRKKAFHHRCKVGFAACIFLYHLASYWTTLLVRFLYKILCPHSLQRMTSVGFSVFSAPAPPIGHSDALWISSKEQGHTDTAKSLLQEQ